jgi:hypothetical protein
VRPRLLLALVAGLTVVSPAAAHSNAAQAPRLAVTPPPEERASVEGPRITTTGVLSDSKLQEFIRSGFPARLHYRIELWSRKQGFDDRLASAVWIFFVDYDQLQRTYTIRRQAGDRLIPSGPYRTIAEVQAALATPFEAPVRAPNSRQRMYYHVVLEIEKLSLSDLDELEAWLRGELTPATRGQRNPGTALIRGVQTLFLRMLGGENPRYEASSATFTPR